MRTGLSCADAEATAKATAHAAAVKIRNTMVISSRETVNRPDRDGPPLTTISACRSNYIGGAAPARPTLMAGATNDPSGCFCAAIMIIIAPGLRSSLLPGVKATTGVFGGTITFFSPSLYFTTMVSPSTLATLVSTLALVSYTHL